MKNGNTACSRSSAPFYTVTYYIKWVTTSWIDGKTLIKSYSNQIGYYKTSKVHIQNASFYTNKNLFK